MKPTYKRSSMAPYSSSKWCQINRGFTSLFDAAVLWLASHGFTNQWDETPFPTAHDKWNAASGGRPAELLWFCEANRQTVAALVLAEAPPYVPRPRNPRCTSWSWSGPHTPAARGAGVHRLDLAADQALKQGVELIRVDRFAGNGGALVRFYESCGFHRLCTFTLGDWPGQVLTRQIAS